MEDLGGSNVGCGERCRRQTSSVNGTLGTGVIGAYRGKEGTQKLAYAVLEGPSCKWKQESTGSARRHRIE